MTLIFSIVGALVAFCLVMLAVRWMLNQRAAALAEAGISPEMSPPPSEPDKALHSATSADGGGCEGDSCCCVDPDPLELVEPQRFVVQRRPSSDGPKEQMPMQLARLNEVVFTSSAQEAKQIVANRIAVGTCHLTAQLRPA